MRVFRSKLALMVLLLIAAASVYFIFFHHGTLESRKQPGVTVKQSTAHKHITVTTANDENSKTQKPTAVDQDITIQAPSGIFVSNHHPNLDNDPAPNSMNSVCRTTPGISCEIRFTKNGVTKALGPDTTGTDGSVSWDWRLQDLGLTEGSWEITAVASHNGKSTPVTDSIKLEVGQ